MEIDYYIREDFDVVVRDEEKVLHLYHIAFVPSITWTRSWVDAYLTVVINGRSHIVQKRLFQEDINGSVGELMFAALQRDLPSIVIDPEARLDMIAEIDKGGETFIKRVQIMKVGMSNTYSERVPLDDGQKATVEYVYNLFLTDEDNRENTRINEVSPLNIIVDVIIIVENANYKRSISVSGINLWTMLPEINEQVYLATAQAVERQGDLEYSLTKFEGVVERMLQKMIDMNFW